MQAIICKEKTKIKVAIWGTPKKYLKRDSLIMICFKSAVLNLGYAYPQGYVRRLQGVRKEPTGVRKILKTSSKWSLFGYNFLFGGTQRGQGYAEGYNFDLGVREHQKFENPCFKWLCKKLYWFCIYNKEKQTVFVSLLFSFIESAYKKNRQINFFF